VFLAVNEDPYLKGTGTNVNSEVMIKLFASTFWVPVEVETVDGLTELLILEVELRRIPILTWRKCLGWEPVSRGDHLITVFIDIPA